MIDGALTFLRDQVNEFIAIKTGDADKVELTNIVDGTGAVLITDDKIGCTLVNIEEERLAKSQSPYGEPSNGKIPRRNPEIKLNLYILFAANPQITTALNNYDQGLKLLSHVISFFQSKSLFDGQNSPALDPSIEKLILELYTIPIEQQNYLWGALGAKYLPSVVYRVRLLTVQENIVLLAGEGVKNVDRTASPSNN